MTDRSPVPPSSPTPERVARRGNWGRWVLRVAGVVLVAFVIVLLGVRSFVLPRADEHREWLVQRLSQAAGVPVSIGRLQADWPGIALRVQAFDLNVGEGPSPLRVERIEAELAWSSLLTGLPNFHRITLISPDVSVVRDGDGRMHVAGMPMSGSDGDGGVAAWLFEQGEFVIENARLAWDDRLRGAPLLELEHFGLRVVRTAGRYRFGLEGRPDVAIAQRISLRGDLVSDRPADISRWDGQLHAQVVEGRLDGLAPWLDYPWPVSGVGNVEAWSTIEDGEPNAGAVDFALADFRVQLEEHLPELAARSANGRLTAARDAKGTRFALEGFELQIEDGLRVEPTDIELNLTDAGGLLRASSAELGVVVQLSAHVPLSDAARRHITEHDPRGRIEGLRIDWASRADTPEITRLEGRFTGLAVRPSDSLPGAEGLSGELSGDGDAGRFVLTSRDAVLDIPQVFEASRLSFDELNAEGGWSRGEQGLEVRVERATFESPDVSGEAEGVYRPMLGRLGEIDVTARLSRAEGNSVWRYVPRNIGDETRTWLQQGIRKAMVHDARLTLRGGLADFPFEDGSGEFVVTVDLTDGVLEYAPDWPAIEGIVASLRFEGPGLRISAGEGRIFGVQLRDVVAELPDLDVRNEQPMTLRGVAKGATSDFLRFVSESPVRDTVNGFTDDMSAQGEGELDLTLVMPLHDVDATKVKGAFRFAGNTVKVTEWLPPVERASGRVVFSESTFGIEEGRGRAFGQPLQISARTLAPRDVRFNVKGGATMRAVAAQYEWPGLSHLSGSANWQADIAVTQGRARVDVRSTLAGLSSSLPHPFNKSASEAWPLQVEVGFAGDVQDVRISLEDRLEAVFSGRDEAGRFDVTRGAIGVHSEARMPERGLSLHVTLDELDLDAWRDLIDSESAGPAQGQGVGNGLTLPWAAVRANVGSLRVLDQELKHFDLTATASQGAWNGRVSSDLVQGGFAWHEGEQGTLALRLDHLRLGKGDAGEADKAVLSRALRDESSQQSMPDMDIVAEHFYLNDSELGRLALQARNEDGAWLIDSASLANADAKLTARGRWVPGDAPLTQLSVRLDSPDVGQFLSRMGYPETIRNGAALLTGELEWKGAPTRIDYSSLNGAFRLDAEKGRFAKLEPGVGRLLGVLSLQALPRRLALDFRDVFSDGFAFDRIGGDVSLQQGVLHSDDFQIAGPAARVWIAGTIDLKRETQDIKAVVQPALTDGVAIGAAAGLVNPVAGLIAYLAQKALNDPIERMFAYGYAITGRWDDPQVEKLAGGNAAREAQAADDETEAYTP